MLGQGLGMNTEQAGRPIEGGKCWLNMSIKCRLNYSSFGPNRVPSVKVVFFIYLPPFTYVFTYCTASLYLCIYYCTNLYNFKAAFL